MAFLYTHSYTHIDKASYFIQNHTGQRKVSLHAVQDGPAHKKAHILQCDSKAQLRLCRAFCVLVVKLNFTREEYVNEMQQ